MPGQNDWLNPYLAKPKEQLLAETDPATLNKIREAMGDQNFIDHWKLTQDEYARIVPPQQPAPVQPAPVQPVKPAPVNNNLHITEPNNKPVIHHPPVHHHAPVHHAPVVHHHRPPVVHHQSRPVISQPVRVSPSRQVFTRPTYAQPSIRTSYVAPTTYGVPTTTYGHHYPTTTTTVAPTRSVVYGGRPAYQTSPVRTTYATRASPVRVSSPVRTYGTTTGYPVRSSPIRSSPVRTAGWGGYPTSSVVRRY